MFEEVKESSPVGTPNLQVVLNATAILNQLALENGEIMLVKWIDNLVSDIEAKIGQDNVLLGSLVRENVLDQLICNVKDCFNRGKRFGYPVFAGNKSKSDLCFGRRKDENVKMKVYIRPERFKEMIVFLRRQLREIESFKLRRSSQTYEELIAFQQSDDIHVFKTSVEAWASLANKYALIDDCTIENILRTFINTRKISYHEDSIMNYEEVFHALQKVNLGNLIRKKKALFYQES